MARAGPGQKQDPKIHCGCPMEMEGTQVQVGVVGRSKPGKGEGRWYVMGPETGK